LAWGLLVCIASSLYQGGTSMQSSGITAAIQGYILAFEKSFQQQPESSSANYAAQPAATAGPGSGSPSQESSASDQLPAGPSQEPPPTADANRYLSAVEGIAALLSSQGAPITDPNLVQFINPHDVKPGSNTVTGNVSGSPATPSYVASQIIEGLGSNGALTLAEVENAENATTGAPTSNSNSAAEIAADFEKLSGGSTTLTARQLADALQTYMASR
jgi:hypothetical protein